MSVYKNLTEKLLIQRYQQEQDRQNQQWIFSEMWERYKNCGISVAKRMLHVIEKQELDCVRMEALHQVLIKFDESKNVDFVGYLFMVVRNLLYDQYRLYVSNQIDSLDQIREDEMLEYVLFSQGVYTELDLSDLYFELDKILDNEEMSFVKKRMEGAVLREIVDSSRIWRNVKRKIEKYFKEDTLLLEKALAV